MFQGHFQEWLPAPNHPPYIVSWGRVGKVWPHPPSSQLIGPYGTYQQIILLYVCAENPNCVRSGFVYRTMWKNAYRYSLTGKSLPVLVFFGSGHRQHACYSDECEQSRTGASCTVIWQRSSSRLQVQVPSSQKSPEYNVPVPYTVTLYGMIVYFINSLVVNSSLDPIISGLFLSLGSGSRICRT
jgi:hypothetical protein